MEFKLSKPLTFEEKTYEVLTLDLESLTGADMEQVEREFAALGQFSGMVETSKIFLAMLAARAAGVRVDLVKKLPLKDYSKLTMQGQTFLFG